MASMIAFSFAIVDTIADLMTAPFRAAGSELGLVTAIAVPGTANTYIQLGVPIILNGTFLMRFGIPAGLLTLLFLGMFFLGATRMLNKWRKGTGAAEKAFLELHGDETKTWLGKVLPACTNIGFTGGALLGLGGLIWTGPWLIPGGIVLGTIGGIGHIVTKVKMRKILKSLRKVATGIDAKGVDVKQGVLNEAEREVLKKLFKLTEKDIHGGRK